jgi:beta-lactamase regulating signal transducer with metallopeptidase domain
VAVLLNWLTQGLIVSIAAAAGLRLIPASRAQARYAFLWAAYLLVLALPLIAVIPAAVDVQPVDLPLIPDGPVLTVPAAWWASSALAIGLWIVWAAARAVQFVTSAVALRNARRISRQCPGDVLARLDHWPRLNASGRRTRVVLSNDVRVAAVLGGGRPMIALAPGIVDQLSAPDLDRVLIHEWAHVQRWDDVAQVVQRVVRMIVGWHPAAWWLERQLEFERELACDSIAVGVTGSAKRYATCLATLAALPHAPVRPLPALAAVSARRLNRRLLRILASQSDAHHRLRHLSIACAGMGLIVVALAVGNVHAVRSATTWTPDLPPSRPTLTGAVATVVSAPTVPVELPASRTNSVSRPRLQSGGSVRSKRFVLEGSRDGGGVRLPEQTPASDIPSAPLPSAQLTLGTVAMPAAVVRTQIGGNAHSPALGATAPPGADKQVAARAEENAAAPWTAAANAGIALGRASQTAGAATGGFFSRFGKTIARSF